MIRIDRGGVDIDMLSAVIHLDHKYELPTLQAQAMSYLTAYYTSHFEHWVDGTHATPWKPTPLDAIGAIAIAHLTNTMSILPTTFYDLCSASVLDVLKGHARSDGSFQKLSEDDLELYIRTRDKLTYLNARVPFLLFRPAKDCIFGRHAVTECAVHMKAILSSSGLSHLPHTITSVRALDSWLQNLSEHAATNADTDHCGTLPGLCARCKSYVEKRDRELRQQVWRKLPGGMGITVEGWDASS